MKGVSVFTQGAKCSRLVFHIACGQPESDPRRML